MCFVAPIFCIWKSRNKFALLIYTYSTSYVIKMKMSNDNIGNIFNGKVDLL